MRSQSIHAHVCIRVPVQSSPHREPHSYQLIIHSTNWGIALNSTPHHHQAVSHPTTSIYPVPCLYIASFIAMCNRVRVIDWLRGLSLLWRTDGHKTGRHNEQHTLQNDDTWLLEQLTSNTIHPSPSLLVSFLHYLPLPPSSFLPLFFLSFSTPSLIFIRNSPPSSVSYRMVVAQRKQNKINIRMKTEQRRHQTSSSLDRNERNEKDQNTPLHRIPLHWWVYRTSSHASPTQAKPWPEPLSLSLPCCVVHYPHPNPPLSTDRSIFVQ